MQCHSKFGLSWSGEQLFICRIQKSMGSIVIMEATLIERDQYRNKKSVLS